VKAIVEELIAHLERESEAIWREEPDELRLMRQGLLPNEAGSYGQYWSTWDFANGMIRDFSMYTMYPIYRLALEDGITLDALRRMVLVIHPPYSEYLRYSGCITLSNLDRELMSALEHMTSKDEFITAYRLLTLYANKLAAWSYHYFPWELGVLFPQKTASGLKSDLALLEGANLS